MNSLFVHESSFVKDTIGDNGSKIYKECDIRNSSIGSNSTVGDFSRLNNCNLSNNVAIQRNAMMYNVDIGKYTYTGKNFTAWHCSIGAFCSISWNVSIGGANHDYMRTTTHSFLYSADFGLSPDEAEPAYDRFSDTCVIENDVWIAANACICRGVTVHTGAVVAAGAIVTHDVEPYTIVAGVPARPIKKRFDDKTIELLLESKWWEFPDDIIKANFKLFKSYADENVAERLVYIQKKINEG